TIQTGNPSNPTFPLSGQFIFSQPEASTFHICARPDGSRLFHAMSRHLKIAPELYDIQLPISVI
ncbi:hypothetical protein AX14_013106, partial [Amanita brunnescens Koide BX004]